MQIKRSTGLSTYSMVPRWGVAGFISLVAAQGVAIAQPSVDADPTSLSLEQLINVEVYSASKFNQKVSDAPVSVTVVTRDDIRTHGYRTIADIIRSVRGMYSYYDRTYEYVGIRGFARLGDYSSRVLLLIDGYRANDNIYDSASIGTDGPIDVDLIERVEFVRGPSSSLFGGNAFFGVINVITRKARDMATAEVAGSIGSAGTSTGRVTLARKLEGGLEMMVSASGLRSRGRDLYFQDFDDPATNNGLAQGVDYDRNKQIFGKFEYEGFKLSAGQSERTKGVGFGVYGSDFNDPRNYWKDRSSFVDASYGTALSGGLDLSVRTSYGDYRFLSVQPYLQVDNDNIVEGQWWTAESKLTALLSSRHRIVGGLEYQQNTRQLQRVFDVDPFVSYLEDTRRSHRTGVYLQDEYAWIPTFTTTVGLRYDRLTSGKLESSPRLAAVWHATQATTVKAMYGTAFRAANVYEAYSSFPDVAIANTDLKPESIRSVDLILEQYLSKDMRLVINGYQYKIRDLISQVTDPATGLQQFQNVDSIDASGVEAELEYIWASGARLRSSTTFQSNRDNNGQILANSPRQLYKAAFSIPLGIGKLKLGTDWQYIGPRTTLLGEVGGHAIVNINVSRDPGKLGWGYAIGVRNLFDRRFHDPNLDGGLANRDRMRQDGRSFRLSAEYKF